MEDQHFFYAREGNNDKYINVNAISQLTVCSDGIVKVALIGCSDAIELPGNAEGVQILIEQIKKKLLPILKN